MLRGVAAITLLLATVGLSSCGRPTATAANDKMCVDFKQPRVSSTLASSDGAGAVDECARRWAYSLAPSRDDAGLVANAVVAACGVSLSRWNQQILAQVGDVGDATSLTTGEPTTPLAEHNTFAHNRALLYVIQARAGNCKPPPATNGVPDGIS